MSTNSLVNWPTLVSVPVFEDLLLIVRSQGQGTLLSLYHALSIIMPLTHGLTRKEFFSAFFAQISSATGFIPGGCGQGAVVPETAPGT
jgi:hypothetical protein